MSHQAQPEDDRASGRIFLCGADMEPAAVRQHHPAARFVARARWQTSDGVPAWYPVTDLTPAEIWGILIEAATPATGEAVTVVTDDGRTLAATLGTDAATVGDLSGVLANARYWELPPAFVRQLQAATGQPMVEATEG